MPSPFHPLQLVLGLTVWIIWFAVVYGLLSVACIAAPPEPEHRLLTWINGVLLMVTVATAGLLLYWAHACWWAARNAETKVSPPQRLIVRVAVGGHLTGAAATLAVGSVILFLPPCL